jgi:nitrite reductase (NADH) small subunit
MCYFSAMKTRLTSVSELPAEGEAREFECAGKQVCVARVNGQLSAMDNVCPHRGGPLGGGVIDEGKLICPWHGWQFDPTSGKSLHVPGAGVAIYPITTEGDDVFVEL